MHSLRLSEPKSSASDRVLEATLLAGTNRARVWMASDLVLVSLIAAGACALHFFAASSYGYFRDELYYAACGQHLAWGYVDHAPLIAVIAWFVRGLFGDSLLSLRLFPALSASGKVFLTAWIVREFDGQRFAQLLAATAILICPIYLTMDSFLSMNSFEPLFWTSCAAIAVRIANRGPQQLWLLFGTVAGLGLLNKHSTLFFGLAIVLALFFSSGTRYFRNPWIWSGGLIALAIFLPNLLWEIRNHFPTIEILRNVARMKNAHVPWYSFIAQQALLVHPLGAPICLFGLWYFFVSEKGEPYRFLGWTYLFLLLQMLVLDGRIYYLAPVYPMLFAAGAVWMEYQIAKRSWKWAKPAILIPLVVGGLVAAPLAMPLLPVNTAAAYARFWDVNKIQVQNYDPGPLPQFFADMFGWPHQAAVVGSVYRALTPSDRHDCGILAGNYGEAGAIDYFGAAYGLPRAISGHNNYYLWGPRGYSGDVVIAFGIRLQDLCQLFGSVQQVATINDFYAGEGENNVPVYICRQPRDSLSKMWYRLKFFG